MVTLVVSEDPTESIADIVLRIQMAKKDRHVRRLFVPHQALTQTSEVLDAMEELIVSTFSTRRWEAVEFKEYTKNKVEPASEEESKNWWGQYEHASAVKASKELQEAWLEALREKLSLKGSPDSDNESASKEPCIYCNASSMSCDSDGQSYCYTFEFFNLH